MYSERFLREAPELVDRYLEETRADDAKYRVSGKKLPVHIARILSADRNELIRAMALASRKLTTGATEAFNQVFGREIGVLSLSERHDNLLMWGHYARDHQGFVIEFNRDHQFFSEPKDDLRPVLYSNRRPARPGTEIDEVDFFYTKSRDWKYEREWRFIRYLDKADARLSGQPQDVCLFRLPRESVSSVILGCRVLQKVRDEMLELLAREPACSHIRVISASIHPTKYQLQFEEIGSNRVAGGV